MLAMCFLLSHVCCSLFIVCCVLSLLSDVCCSFLFVGVLTFDVC